MIALNEFALANYSEILIEDSIGAPNPDNLLFSTTIHEKLLTHLYSQMVLLTGKYLNLILYL